MVNQLLALAKTEVGFMKGLYKSKKFSLSAIWMLACIIFADRAKSPELAGKALYAGAIVISVYLSGQSFVEFAVAKAAALEKRSDR